MNNQPKNIQQIAQKGKKIKGQGKQIVMPDA